jgi:AraC-like DNA-binding protein
MGDLDAFFRGGAAGIALLFGIVFWRAGPHSDVGRIGSAYTAGAVGYLLWGHPGSLTWPSSVRLGLAIFALSPPFFFWAFARLIFEDGFELRPGYWLWLALVEGAGVGQFVLRDSTVRWLPGLLGLGFRVVSIGLIAHALWAVWRGRQADLVEPRARLRLVVFLSAGVGAALILVLALLYAPAARRPPPVQLDEAIMFLVMGLMSGAVVFEVNRDLLPVTCRDVRISRKSISPAYTGEPASTNDDVQTGNALARLDILMTQDEVWRETGLTIGDLAARVPIPEYRLRRLINQRLGFRNFTAFLNEYRLAAATDRLADPKQSRTPILTIALDLGWGSIGPFNRSFRARYGMPPSDFRRERIRAAGHRSSHSLIPEKFS